MKSVISASSTPTTTPSPIDAALPVICALVWIVPPPSSSWKTTSALAWPWPPGLLGLDAQHGAMRGGVLLGDLDGAGELHRHRPHLHHDLGLDRLRPRASRARGRPRRTARRARGRGSRRSCRRSASRSRTSDPAQRPCRSSPFEARRIDAPLYASARADSRGHVPARARQRHARRCGRSGPGRRRRPGTTSLIHVTAWEATLEVGEDPGGRASS